MVPFIVTQSCLYKAVTSPSLFFLHQILNYIYIWKTEILGRISRLKNRNNMVWLCIGIHGNKLLKFRGNDDTFDGNHDGLK